MPDQLANQGIRVGSGEPPAATFIDHKRHATYRQAFAIDYRDNLEASDWPGSFRPMHLVGAVAVVGRLTG